MESGEKWPVNFACDSDSHVNNRDFYMPQICDMRQTALLFARKNSMASAMLTKGKHANH
jgi:hypothetical protein